MTAIHAQTQSACDTTYENHNQVDYGPLQLRAVQGIVVDADVVVIPDVCLVIFDQGQKVIAVARSDAYGRYSFPHIGRGRYRLLARYDGFTVANIPIEISGWPRRGVLRKSSVTIHMKLSGIDITSYGERR